MHVDPICERAREPTAILQDFRRGAHAWPGGVASVAAGTRIHGGRQSKAGWESDRRQRPRDGDEAILHRLTQRLQHAAWKLEELVEKQHAVVCETYFARTRSRSTADESRRRHRVMRGAKG